MIRDWVIQTLSPEHYLQSLCLHTAEAVSVSQFSQGPSPPPWFHYQHSFPFKASTFRQNMKCWNIDLSMLHPPKPPPSLPEVLDPLPPCRSRLLLLLKSVCSEGERPLLLLPGVKDIWADWSEHWQVYHEHTSHADPLDSFSLWSHTAVIWEVPFQEPSFWNAPVSIIKSVHRQFFCFSLDMTIRLILGYNFQNVL